MSIVKVPATQLMCNGLHISYVIALCTQIYKSITQLNPVYCTGLSYVNMQETLEKRKETKRNEKKRNEKKRKETARSSKKRNERIRTADLYEVLLNLEIIQKLSKQTSNSNLMIGNVAFCYHCDEIQGHEIF